MVNVAQYQIVATGSTVSECEQKYVQLLGSKGITTPEERPQTEASGVIAELRSAVLDGNTYYFIRLEGEEVFYSVSASQNEVAVILNVGDSVTIEHEVPAGGQRVAHPGRLHHHQPHQRQFCRSGGALRLPRAADRRSRMTQRADSSAVRPLFAR